MIHITLALFCTVANVFGLDPTGISGRVGPAEPVSGYLPHPPPNALWTVSNAGGVQNANGQKCRYLHPHCSLCSPGFKTCRACEDLTSANGLHWALSNGRCVVTLTFEEFALPYNTESSAVSDGYAGLVWSNFYVMTSVQLYTYQVCDLPNGYRVSATSGNTSIYNGAGIPAFFASPDASHTFCVSQLSVTSAWQPVQTVSFTGFKANGDEVHFDFDAVLERPSLAIFPDSFCDLVKFLVVSGSFSGCSGLYTMQVAIDDIVLLDSSRSTLAKTQRDNVSSPPVMASTANATQCQSSSDNIAAWGWVLIGAAGATVACCGIAIIAIALRRRGVHFTKGRLAIFDAPNDDDSCRELRSMPSPA